MANEMIHNIATYHYEDEAIRSNLDKIEELENKVEMLDGLVYNQAFKRKTFESIRTNDIRDFADTRAGVLQYIHLMPGSLDIEQDEEEIEDYFKKYLTDSSFQRFMKLKEKADSLNMQEAFTFFCESLKMNELKPFGFRWENWKQSFPGKRDYE